MGGTEHLNMEVKVVLKNIRAAIEEISKGTEEIILSMQLDLEQGRVVVVEMLIALSTTKSNPSTITITSLAEL